MSKDMDDARQWAEEAFDRNRKGIAGSETFVMMFSGGRDDALQCLQLGMAIMMNKPILVLADSDVPVPKTLARVAVKVTKAQMKDPAEIAAEIKKFMEELDNE